MAKWPVHKRAAAAQAEAMLGSRPSSFSRPQRRPSSAGLWLGLAAALLIAGLIGWAWWVPADPLESQTSAVVERCTVAFSAQQFAAASQLLGMPVSGGSFKVLPSTVRPSSPQGSLKVWTASVAANLVVGGKERFPAFTCFVSPQGVTFRLQPAPPALPPADGQL
ncbi:hypothetical protein FNU79_07250 [Deinococcus detaillensis]|uniref:Uncharacterized protein n=1 Tax=Deinococcus detaillensis TaxID=2592048 RepID=A0A553V1W5_9DEIO|nr:hypothetical protein [Deinococcus detaillensis]TSA86440.1 hypothetical protein FNU79_07250 [Deinococcus detaillensis]